MALGLPTAYLTLRLNLGIGCLGPRTKDNNGCQMIEHGFQKKKKSRFYGTSARNINVTGNLCSSEHLKKGENLHSFDGIGFKKLIIKSPKKLFVFTN